MVTTIIMFGIATFLTGIAYLRGVHFEGLKTGGKNFLNFFPLLLASFIVAGLIEALIPKDVVVRWMGKESGWRGIILGWVVGSLMGINPYALFPIIAGFYRTGASIACLVTLLAAWGLGTVGRLPLEIGILGVKFTLTRVACTFFLPPIAGFLAKIFFS